MWPPPLIIVPKNYSWAGSPRAGDLKGKGIGIVWWGRGAARWGCYSTPSRKDAVRSLLDQPMSRRLLESCPTGTWQGLHSLIQDLLDNEVAQGRQSPCYSGYQQLEQRGRPATVSRGIRPFPSHVSKPGRAGARSVGGPGKEISPGVTWGHCGAGGGWLEPVREKMNLLQNCTFVDVYSE